VFALWWWYFDLANGEAERHVRTTRDAIRFQIWSHAHFLLYLSTAVLGVGIGHVISLGIGAHLMQEYAWILVGAAFAVMTTLTIIGATTASRESAPTLVHANCDFVFRLCPSARARLF
jgi:low temperature requirement protein LtrA